MSWRAEAGKLAASAAACVLATACAGADAPGHHVAAPGVCPVHANAAVTQIDIFDGDPAGLAFLAPDDERDGEGVYTVKDIYAKGRIVTVRCHYGASVVEDVRLTKPVARCLFSGGDAHPTLVCE